MQKAKRPANNEKKLSALPLGLLQRSGSLAGYLVNLGHEVIIANSRGPETSGEVATETKQIPMSELLTSRRLMNRYDIFFKEPVGGLRR